MVLHHRRNHVLSLLYLCNRARRVTRCMDCAVGSSPCCKAGCVLLKGQLRNCQCVPTLAHVSAVSVCVPCHTCLVPCWCCCCCCCAHSPQPLWQCLWAGCSCRAAVGQGVQHLQRARQHRIRVQLHRGAHGGAGEARCRRRSLVSFFRSGFCCDCLLNTQHAVTAVMALTSVCRAQEGQQQQAQAALAHASL